MTTTLTRKRPEGSLQSLESLQDQINRLFDLSFNRGGTLAETAIPAVDISEDKDNVYIDADMPGFEQKDISLSVNEDQLLLSANREEVKEEKKKNYYRSERSSGTFYRELYLPSIVDASRAKASYRNGVLKVTLPKRETEKGKEIKINVE